MESSDDEKDGVFVNYIPKEISHTLASNGTKFVDEVLNGQNEHCLENFCMDKHIFYKLCDILQARGLLRHTNRIKVEEQLAIFMFIIGHNLRTRAVQELFRYSGETISRHFKEKPDDWIFRMYEQEAELEMEDPMPLLEIEQQSMLNDENQFLDLPFGEEELECVSQLRDSIAAEIWNDYIRDFSAM